jgi:hypothetical protein
MELESGQKKDCAVLHSTRSAIPADTFPTLKPQLPGPRWQLVRGSAAMQRLCFQPLPLTIRDSQVSLPSPSGALLIWPTGTTPASRNLLSVIATANFRMGQQPSPSLTLQPSAASLLLLLLGRKSAGSGIFLAARARVHIYRQSSGERLHVVCGEPGKLHPALELEEVTPAGGASTSMASPLRSNHAFRQT